MKTYFRPFTNDVNIFQEVVDINEYNLPDIINPTDVIIDIGAHIGSFIYACLKRGAKNIYAYEALKENYDIAISNFEDEIKQGIVKIYNLAVWRSDTANVILHNSGYGNMQNPNTGISNVFAENIEGSPVNTISLDEILDEIINTNNNNNTGINTGTRNILTRNILIKCDCEGSEYAIFLTSKKLKLVDYICGEYHIFGLEKYLAKDIFMKNTTIANGHILKDYLDKQGFDTILFEKPLTLFFSKKKEHDKFFKNI